MIEDLLSKEKGFYEVNKELEQKARVLMNKINHVIGTCSNQNAISNSGKEPRGNTKLEIDPLGSLKKLNGNVPSSLVERNSSLPNIQLQNDALNEVSKRKNLANETVINLFRAKIDVLLGELQTIRAEYQKKCDLCKHLESENRKYEIKVKSETESFKEATAKLESTIKELQCQSQILNSENIALKKDLSRIQKQMTIANQESNNCIVRLNRSLESNEKLKNMLKHFEVQEKELKAQTKRLSEDQRSTIHNLGRQLSEVTKVLRKQALIVDNLKKQNACLAIVGQLKLTKEDFVKLLEEKLEASR